MSGERYFLDTAFVPALLNRRDQFHPQARAFLARVRTAVEVWITEAVLVEIGNALSARNRIAAAKFVRECYETSNMRVVAVDTVLVQRALDHYEVRPDKDWGLTDCISFVVMKDKDLAEAVTSDSHFQQAGYRARLVEQS